MTGVAVVTGSSGAIGTAVHDALSTAGYTVVGVDRAEPAASSTRRHVTARLDDEDDVRRAFAHITAEVGMPVVLVNNAGVYLARTFLDTSADDFELVMGSNVRSAFLCAQHFVRPLIAAQQPGAIVNMASVSGRSGSTDAAYGASKGAVIALTKSLGTALAPHRIRVNAVAPGLVDSDMSRRIPADRQASYLSRIPMGRFGGPDEIAQVVLMLAGPAGAYMTGSIVDVNGGLW